MATQVKHVGNFAGKKVVLAYRTLPNEPLNALVIPTERLTASYHDELFKVVESQNGQDAFELATVLAPKKFADGNNMLVTLAQQNLLVKVETKDVTVTPSPQKETWLPLDKLNEQIAEQRGVSISDLAVKEESNEDTALTKKDTARNYRNRADTLYKEVIELRRRADEIDPPATTKKSTSKKDTVDA